MSIEVTFAIVVLVSFGLIFRMQTEATKLKEKNKELESLIIEASKCLDESDGIDMITNYYYNNLEIKK